MGQAKRSLLILRLGRRPPQATRKHPAPFPLRRAVTKLPTTRGRPNPLVNPKLLPIRPTITRVSRLPSTCLRGPKPCRPLAKQVGPPTPLTLRHNVFASINKFPVLTPRVILAVRPVIRTERRNAFGVILDSPCNNLPPAPESLINAIPDANLKSPLNRNRSGQVKSNSVLPTVRQVVTLKPRWAKLRLRTKLTSKQIVMDVNATQKVDRTSRECRANLCRSQTVITFVITRAVINLQGHPKATESTSMAVIRAIKVACELTNIWTKTGVTVNGTTQTSNSRRPTRNDATSGKTMGTDVTNRTPCVPARQLPWNTVKQRYR